MAGRLSVATRAQPWRFEGSRRAENDHDCNDHRTPAAAARVLQASRRSAVPSFIVMDVMQAAAEREAAGPQGHPHGGWPARHTCAPRRACRRRPRTRDPRRWATRSPWVCPRCASASPATMRNGTGSPSSPSVSWLRPARRPASCWPFWRLFDAGAKVALPSPGYPCYRHILTALGQIGCPASRPVPNRAGCRPAPTSTMRCAGMACAGLVVASPANPTGTMLEPARLAEIAAACARNRIWLVSDEIYHGLDLRHARGDGACPHPTRPWSSTASRNTSR